MAILPFSLTNGATADADDVNTLLQAIASIVDGGITTAQFAPGIGITAGYIGAVQEEQVQLYLPAQTLLATGIVGIPVPVNLGPNGTLTDIIVDGLVATAVGTVAPIVSVVAGTMSGGTFTSSGAIGTATSLGDFTSGHRFTVTLPAVSGPTGATHLAFNCNTIQTGAQTYALNATIRFKRSLQ